jgi:chromosome segregation ATPase
MGDPLQQLLPRADMDKHIAFYRKELAEAKEIIELYKAMKEGVEIRLFDLQAERDRLKVELAQCKSDLEYAKYELAEHEGPES